MDKLAYSALIQQCRDQILADTAKGGASALPQIISETNGQPKSRWIQLQGDMFGLFICFFYLWNGRTEEIELLASSQNDIKALILPTLDYIPDRGWYYDHTMDIKLKQFIMQQRPVGDPEFHRILNLHFDWRLSAFERSEGMLLCDEGEVSAFIFEWRLRQFWEKRCLSRSSGSVESFLNDVFDKDGSLLQECQAMGWLDGINCLRPRAERLLAWICQTFAEEQSAHENRFSLMKGGEPWSAMFLSSGRICNSRDVEKIIDRERSGRDKLKQVASLMLYGKAGRRTEEDVRRRARFFLPSHYLYRYNDSGLPKNAFALCLLSHDYPCYAVGGADFQELFSSDSSRYSYPVAIKERLSDLKAILVLLSYSEAASRHGKLATEYAKYEAGGESLARGAHVLKRTVSAIVTAIDNLGQEFTLEPHATYKLLRQRAVSASYLIEMAARLGAENRTRLQPKDKDVEIVNLKKILVKAYEELWLVKVIGPLRLIGDCETNVQANAKYLQFLFAEIFTNAYDHRRKDRQSLMTATVKIDALLMYITIEDNGIGDSTLIGRLTFPKSHVERREHLGVHNIRTVVNLHCGDVGFLRSDERSE